jgi:hypothetical protein
MEDLDASKDLSYQECRVKILETSEIVTQNKRIKMSMVQWCHHTKEEATWEREEEMKVEFLSFLSICLNHEYEIHFKVDRFVTPYFSQNNKTQKLFILINKSVCCIHVVA